MDRPPPHQIPNSISMGFALQDSPPSSALKLPLAPILSAPDRIRNNPNLPLRRGSSIFSPSQTLDPPRHQPQHSPDPDPPPPPSTTAHASSDSPNPPPTLKYRECLKNHAAAMGGHVVDGCGEFMPSGEDGTPESLRCAACDCHRNFHRKEGEGNTITLAGTAAQQIQGGQITYSVAPPHLRHRHKQHQNQTAVVSNSAHPPPPAAVNFGAESSSEDLNMFQSGGSASASASKKRYRTKFSQNQKDRMEEFAAKLGWRFQKQCEEEVQRFCSEVGVARQVFKIWMHNNKQASKRRQI